MRVDEQTARQLLSSLNFKDGLVTAVVRDWRTKQVLMVAHQNEEAFIRTMVTGIMHYWSRSRKKIWMKGETSGHIQRVRRVYLDCDGDSLLYDVEQKIAACHEGYFSCFFRRLRKGKWQIYLKRRFNPSEVY